MEYFAGSNGPRHSQDNRILATVCLMLSRFFHTVWGGLMPDRIWPKGGTCLSRFATRPRGEAGFLLPDAIALTA